MFDYQFMIKLDGIDERSAQVRVWIDDQLAGDLSSEKEVALTRETQDSWSARLSTPGAFIYRVGIVAAPGTRWSLSVWTGRDQEELLFDSDELTMPKEWLVGTCEGIELPTQLRPRAGAEAHS